MCGIFGIMQHKTESIPNQQNLEISASLLRHRGPDNYGIFTDNGIGLVSRQLFKCLIERDSYILGILWLIMKGI